MNAETRAKEIARILRDAIVAESNGKFEAEDADGRIWVTCDDSNAAVDCEVVAAAILPLIIRAENDKLEEAAQIASDEKNLCLRQSSEAKRSVEMQASAAQAFTASKIEAAISRLKKD